MKSKYYSVAGLTLKVDSEEEIGNSKMYGEFCLPPQKEDLTVTVDTSSPLPPKNGEILFTAHGRECFIKNGITKLFSSYYTPSGRIDYSCRVVDGEEIKLFVNYPEGLWDSMLFNALNIPELTAQKGIFLCHSSFVIHKGEALIFTAGKGSGKSTQAALWNTHRGAEIINGDRSFLKFENGRLYAYGTPYCGSSQIAVNKSAPVKAVILLKKGTHNHINTVSGIEAFAGITAQLSFEKYQNDKASAFAAEVCETAPVYSLECVPDISAVNLLEETLWQI